MLDKFIPSHKVNGIKHAMPCNPRTFNTLTGAKSDEEREAAIQTQRKHKMEADFSYKLRPADHKRALDKYCSKYFSCADIDFAGGFRNPWLPIQIAYYKRICPMTNFIIAGPDFVDMYGYDETIAGKGPDEVCSFVYHWLNHGIFHLHSSEDEMQVSLM